MDFSNICQHDRCAESHQVFPIIINLSLSLVDCVTLQNQDFAHKYIKHFIIFLLFSFFSLPSLFQEDLLTVVEGDDVQTVEQLSLILMNSLDLNVKHGVGVDLDFVVLFQMHGELHLVLLEEAKNI